jgi:mRNA-degrading endonuclease toxin of MazEF toxin-antitoxin module
LVISYSFLWSDEAAEGHAEGRKNRPCAIVLTVAPDAVIHDAPRVYVVPITHRRPKDREAALELPRAVKRHLGLDDQPSWVVLDEVNTFVWPGFDLRPVPGKPGRFAYGFLPPRLLAQLLEKMRALRDARRLSATRR